MPELDARIHAGEHVVEGKLPGSWPKVATAPDTRAARAATASAASKVVATPGTRPGTSRSSTRATAR